MQRKLEVSGITIFMRAINDNFSFTAISVLIFKNYKNKPVL